MKVEIRRIIRASLGVADDDLHRAKTRFAGTDLSVQWGESGQTKQEILNGYQDRVILLNQCLAWVEDRL